MVTRVHHPRGVTAVFNGNLAMATPEGNSVFVGGAGTKVIRGGIRMDADTNEDNDANAKAPRFQGGEWILESDLELARYIIGGVSEADAAHVVVTNGAKIRNWGAARTPSSSPARSTCAAAGSSTIRT